MVFFSIFIILLSIAAIGIGIAFILQKEIGKDERIFDTSAMKKQGAIAIIAGILGIIMAVLLYIRSGEDSTSGYPTMDTEFFKKDSLYLE